MKKRLETLGVPVLAWLLIFQIALGSSALQLPLAKAEPILSAQGPTLVDQIAEAGAKDPLTIEGRHEAEEFATEIETSGPNDFPSKISDTYHLTGQRLDILSGPLQETYDLSTLNVDVPTIVANFDRDVSIEVNRQARELSLVYSKKGAPYAKHTISNVDVVSYAADTELLQFVDGSGRMFALDMVFARGAAFKMPLPVFNIGSLPAEALNKGRLESVFVARGVRPAEVIPNDAVMPIDVARGNDVWTAGDYMVYFRNGDGKRELVGLYKRGVTQMQVYTGTTVVSFLATLVSPPDDTAVMSGAVAPLEDPIVGGDAAEEAGRLDPLTREAISAYDNRTMALLKKRAAANKSLAATPRDRLAFDEWASEHQKLRARAAQELENLDPKQMLKDGGKRYAELREMLGKDDFSPDWQKVVTEALGSGKQKRGLIYRFMTSKAMKAIAMITGGYFVVKGVGALKNMELTPETARPLAWAISASNWLYDHAWPEVLRNEAYRNTLFKSWFALSSFVPALQVVGMIYGGAKGWGSSKAKAALGIRAYAAFVLPFWIHLARIAHQPNLMPALRLGVNPFAKVSQDSAVGKALGLTQDVRPGLVSVGADRAQDARVKREVIKALAVQKARLKSYAFLLADIAVGEKFGIDPATMLLARGNKLPGGAAATELLNNPAFVQEWMAVARELAVTLRDLKQGALLGDLSEVPAQEIATDYQAAKAVASRLAERGKLGSLFSTLKVRWAEFGGRFAKGTGGYGVEQYNFLKNVEPSDSVTSASWQQFFADYLLSVVQMGIVGERARLADPANLAASESGILFTNKAQFADMLDAAIRSYGMENPASLVLTFQKDPILSETRYQPIENLTMIGTPRVDTFTHGLLAWTKGVLNLRKADYGALFLKSLKNRIRTMQASLVLSMTARMTLAGQGFAEALTGYSFLFLYGMPGYNWPWMLITQGNGTYESDMREADGEFMAAKVKLAQGLRLSDSAQISSGYDDLSGIFSKYSDGDLPQDLYEGLLKAEEFLKIPDAERLAELEKLEDFYGQAARLRAALAKNDPAEIAATYEQVRSQYHGEVSEQMKALNARALLEVALKEPPFRNKAHPFVTWSTTIIGSIVTTLWSTALFAASYTGGITYLNVIHAFWLSVEFYSGTYFGQKAINKLASRIDYILAHEIQAKQRARGEKPAEPKPLPASFEEFRQGYIEARAKAFGVNNSDVEAVMDQNGEVALRKRYQTLITRRDAMTQSACETLLISADAVKPLSFVEKLKIIFRGVPQK